VRDTGRVEGEDVCGVRLVGLVLSALSGHERRLTVRHGRNHAELVGGAEHMVGEELPDRLAPAQPLQLRRHLHGNVGAEQVNECGDVGVAECGDVASTSARRWGSVGSTTFSTIGATWAICARARSSALFTAVGVVFRAAAASAAGQDNTSRRISAARRIGGRCCNAAINASLMPVRAWMRSAGSVPVLSSASGIGCSHC
jgi:hypothetical protein